nr:MAG TPA: hypothetical protein [Caudoviricetes sp.]
MKLITACRNYLSSSFDAKSLAFANLTLKKTGVRIESRRVGVKSRVYVAIGGGVNGISGKSISDVMRQIVARDENTNFLGFLSSVLSVCGFMALPCVAFAALQSAVSYL